MAYETVSVRMSRSDPQIPWGFSLRQHGAAVVIGRIDRESLSDKAGLREGDEVESVCGQNARGMSASQAASIADNARFEVTFNMKRLVSGHQCLPWTLTEKDNKVVVDEIRPGFGSGFAHGQYPPAGGQRSSSYSTNEQRSSRTNWDGAIGRDIRQQDAFQNSQFGRNIGSQGQLMAAPPSGGMHSPGSYQRHESSSYSKTHSTSGTGQEPKNESYSTHSESHFSSDGQNQTQSHLSGSSGAPFGSHSLGHGGGGSNAPFSAPRAISSVPYGSNVTNTQSSNQFKSSSTTSGAPFGGSKFGSNTTSYDNRQSSGFGGPYVGGGYGGGNTGSGVGARGGSYGGANGGAGYGHGGAGTGGYGGSNGGAGGYGHGGAGGQGYGAGGHHPAQNYSYNNGATTASYGKNGTGGVPLNKATYINTAPSDFGKASAQSPGSKVFYHSPSPRTRRELSPHASVQHLQYNSPMNLYSSESVAEQFEQQTGRKVDGVPHNAPAYLNSETRKLIEEQEHGRGMRGHSPATQSSSFKRISSAVGAPVQ